MNNREEVKTKFAEMRKLIREGKKSEAKNILNEITTTLNNDDKIKLLEFNRQRKQILKKNKNRCIDAAEN